MRNVGAGIFNLILGIGLVVLAVLSLSKPFFETGLPVFWAFLATGCCAIAIGFGNIRARIWSYPFITGTVVASAVLFVKLFFYVTKFV